MCQFKSAVRVRTASGGVSDFALEALAATSTIDKGMIVAPSMPSPDSSTTMPVSETPRVSFSVKGLPSCSSELICSLSVAHIRRGHLQTDIRRDRSVRSRISRHRS